MRLLILLSLLTLVLVSCGHTDSPKSGYESLECPPPKGDLTDVYVGESLPGIEKLGKFAHCAPESSPVVFKGRLLLVTGHGDYFSIYDFKTQELLLKLKGAALFNSAFVENDTLHILTTDSPRIIMHSTEDLNTWTEEVIFTLDLNQSTQVFNTSVTEGPDGFVLAYEVLEPDSKGYSWRIAISQDLHTWVRVGARFSQEYSACPTVKYVNGYYQFMYLAPSRDNRALVTWVARTLDFVTYEKSPQVFLAPSKGEGMNTSDVDFTEFEGAVYINYLDGNQNGWDDQRLAIYHGTMSEMFSAIWD